MRLVLQEVHVAHKERLMNARVEDWVHVREGLWRNDDNLQSQMDIALGRLNFRDGSTEPIRHIRLRVCGRVWGII